jgi:hypothetical protein
MATANTTNFGSLLKELYTLPPVRALNDKSFLHDKLVKEQATLDHSGKYATFPVTLGRNLGRGSRGDGGILPTAGNETIVSAQVPIKRVYYALEWTEAIEVASKNREGAFENVVDMKMKNVSTDMAKEINRQFYNSTKGILGVVASSTGPLATVVLDSVQYLRVGDSLDIVAVATGTAVTNGTSRVIQSIAKATNTVTFSGATNLTVTAATHGVVLSGSYGFEVEGLRSMASTARTLHNIDSSVAGQEEWDGNTIDASGGTGTATVAGESLFEQLLDQVGARGRGDLDTFITTRGIRRRLADEFASQRRYLDNKAQELHLGYTTIEVAGRECVIDDDCPKKLVLGLKRDSIKVMQATTPGWLETSAGGGARIELKDDTTAGQKVAAFQAWYRYHLALECSDPGVTGQITNCADESN